MSGSFPHFPSIFPLHSENIGYFRQFIIISWLFIHWIGWATLFFALMTLMLLMFTPFSFETIFFVIWILRDFFVTAQKVRSKQKSYNEKIRQTWECTKKVQKVNQVIKNEKVWQNLRKYGKTWSKTWEGMRECVKSYLRPNSHKTFWHTILGFHWLNMVSSKQNITLNWGSLRAHLC